MLKKLFIWAAGIYLCLTAVLFVWDQIKKNGETFRVLGIHQEQTIVGKMHHIVASRQSDGMVLIFDRFSGHSLKAGDEFNVWLGAIMTSKKQAKTPLAQGE